MNKEITSIKDPSIILCRELTTINGRRTHKKMLLYGQEQIEWAIDYGVTLHAVIRAYEFKVSDKIKNYLVHETSEGILKKATETNYLIPLIAIAEYPEVVNQQVDFVVVFDNVVDSGNIGTIIRTAQSFGISSFLSTHENFDPFNRKSLDASRGVVLKSSINNCLSPEDTVSFLKKSGYQIVVTSPYAKHLQSQAPLSKKPIALVIGNETNGVCDYLMKHADVLIQIPMMPLVESLNVGVFTGISLYELKFKMVLLMLKEKILDNLGREVNVTGKLIQEVFNKKIQAVTGLSGMQVILLMIMHCDEVMSLEQIGKDVSLFGKELEDFLQQLIMVDFIQEKNNHHFMITEKGKQFLAEIWPITESANEEILEDFTQEEREQLKDFLKRIQASCQVIIEKNK